MCYFIINIVYGYFFKSIWINYHKVGGVMCNYFYLYSWVLFSFLYILQIQQYFYISNLLDELKTKVRQQWMVNNAALCGVCLQLWQQAFIYYYLI